MTFLNKDCAQSIVQDTHYSFVRQESKALQFSDMKISFMDGFLMYSRLLYSFINPSLVEVLNNSSDDINIICSELSKSYFQTIEFDFGDKVKLVSKNSVKRAYTGDVVDSLNNDKNTESETDTSSNSVPTSTSSADTFSSNSYKRSENSCLDSYICDTCGVTFHEKKQLMKHYYNCHAKSNLVGAYSCEKCDKSFKYKSKLEEHAGVHLEQKYSCHTCGTKFKNQRHLNVHKKSHLLDGDAKDHTCNICFKAFKTIFNLTRHLTIHSKSVNLDFYCNQCKRNFSRKDNLQKHVKKCNSK